MKRIAKCHCGKLSVKVEGEPENIFMCHCELCQRRTGTSYNLGAWFPETQIFVNGKTKEYVRTGDSGSETIFSFCPNCGSNIYWKSPDALPGLISVAVGCFADPTFPAPTISVYGNRHHHWLTLPTDIPRYIGNTKSQQEL